jgi:hypothetical protein
MLAPRQENMVHWRLKMMANREDERWSLTPHEQRDYSTSAERSFFEKIENPAPPTEELKDVYRRYGQYLKNSD